MENFSRVEEVARSLYSESLPYHNFEHALAVRERAKKLVSICLEEGNSVDSEVVELASLLHDAGYHENFKEKGFSSREDYSAHLAKELLQNLGYPPGVIERVASVIISTHKDMPFNSTEEKIVRAADLAEIAGDYDKFLENNTKLKKEAELFLGREIPNDEWKLRTREILEFYLGQDIRLTRKHDNEEGESVFHKEARANLDRFLKL